MLRNVSSGSLEFRQSVRKSSKKSCSLTKSLSTTRETLNRSSSARKCTSLPVSLRRTNCYRRSESSRRTKRRRSFRTGWWWMPSKPTTRTRSNSSRSALRVSASSVASLNKLNSMPWPAWRKRSVIRKRKRLKDTCSCWSRRITDTSLRAAMLGRLSTRSSRCTRRESE